MIKMRATGSDGHPVYVLGITDMNLEALRAGDPLVVQLSQLGAAGGMFFICHGATEDALTDNLVQVGLLTPEVVKAAKEALAKREQQPPGEAK